MQRQQVVRRGNDESPWLTYWQPLFSHHAVNNNNNNMTITKTTTPSTGPRRTGDITSSYTRARAAVTVVVPASSSTTRMMVWRGGTGWYFLLRTLRTCARTRTRTRFETPTRPNIGTSLLPVLAGTERGRPWRLPLLLFTSGRTAVSNRSALFVNCAIPSGSGGFAFAYRRTPSSYRLFFPPHTSLPPSVPTTVSLSHRRISIDFHSHVHPFGLSPNNSFTSVVLCSNISFCIGFTYAILVFVFLLSTVKTSRTLINYPLLFLLLIPAVYVRSVVSRR